MKTYIRTLTLCSGVLTLALTTQAQQLITGWGQDNNTSSGITVTDNGSGNFNVSGTSSGNSAIRADLPTAITLTLGSSVTVSGGFSFTSGSMGAGLFRTGILDYSSLGTLTSGSWSVSDTASGYGYWPSDGGTALS